MPGKNLEEMSLREARKAGKLDEWREQRRKPQPKKSTDSTTTRKESVVPGSVLAVRQLPIPGFLDSITIRVGSPIPGDYAAEIEVRRGGTGISTTVELREGLNEFSNFDFDFNLHKNDLIQIKLVDESSSDEEIAEIDEVITTIATSHA